MSGRGPAAEDAPRSNPAGELREFAPAKINLTLRVIGRLASGYHALESLVAFADVGDVLTLAPEHDHPGGALPSINIGGPFASELAEDTSLEQACRVLHQHSPDPFGKARLHLDKCLPIAAGLGGGSADAAAVLRLAVRAEPRLSSLPWPEITAALGADVTVCHGSEPAIMWSRGERLAAAPSLPASGLVLANPRMAMPADKTARVFRLLAARSLPNDPSPPAGLPPLPSITALGDLIRATGNDLEEPAVEAFPIVTTMLAALRRSPGCLAASMSGAGPTCFALYRDVAGAAAAAELLRVSEPRWWVMATRLRAHGETTVLA